MQEPDIPKTQWGPDPWQEEPDRLEWHYKGFPCLMVRNCIVTGAWCGYVAVPQGHAAFELGYDDDRLDDLDVHGGLTYSDHCQGDICHKPLAGESDNVWWLGFDCAHFSDWMPRLYTCLKHGPNRSEHYWTMSEVKTEVENLADQLLALK